MSKMCRCVKCGHCIVEQQGSWIHVKGGVTGVNGSICPKCGCDSPEPNLNEIDECDSFGAYLKYGLKGECE